MTHARQPSDLSRLPLSPARQPHLLPGRSGQANPLPTRPQTYSGRFIVLSSFCCGRFYFRRRNLSSYTNDPARRFWRGYRSHCDLCGAVLDWRRSKGHSAHSRWWYRRKARLAMQGLTTAGTPRVNRPRYNHTDYCRRRRAANAGRGLTTKGHPRKNPRPVETAWRQFRSTIVLPSGADFLSPSERCDL